MNTNNTNMNNNTQERYGYPTDRLLYAIECTKKEMGNDPRFEGIKNLVVNEEKKYDIAFNHYKWSVIGLFASMAFFPPSFPLPFGVALCATGITSFKCTYHIAKTLLNARKGYKELNLVRTSKGLKPINKKELKQEYRKITKTEKAKKKALKKQQRAARQATPVC